MGLILLVVLSTVVVLLVTTAHDNRIVSRQWETILAPWGRELHQQLVARAAGEAKLTDYAFRRALAARGEGSIEDAVRFLDVGLRLVERTSPDWLTLLRGMALVSRLVAALAPVDPLRPWAFQVPALSGMALVESIVKRFLVGSAERFRLRVYVLGRGFGIAKRHLSASVGRLQSRTGHLSDWDRLEAAREDLGTLREETVATFRALLVSVAARGREA